MPDLSIILIWWATILLVGTTVLPLTVNLFKNFVDRGYIFSKVIGILASSYLIWMLGSLHILPFTTISIILILILLSAVNLIVFVRKNREAKTGFSWSWAVLEEIIFLGSLVFWCFVRGSEPSIRGLEKFMDYGFVNSILRADFFPPLDMWLTKSPEYSGGYFINYYYFGHYYTALLTKLSGLNSASTYNLMISTLFAFTFSLSFSLGSNLIYFFLSLKPVAHGFYQLQNVNMKMKLVAAGLFTAFILTLGGNLHTLYSFTAGYPNETPKPWWQLQFGFFPDRYWYPNATRFIPNTIHEFPIYSFVVSDLHGHVADIPFVLLTIAVLINLIINTVSDHKTKEGKTEKSPGFLGSFFDDFSKFSPIPLPQIFFMGVLIAVMYMTNAWDGLIYMVLTGLVFMYIIFITQKDDEPPLTFFTKTGSAALFLLFFFILANLPFMLNFRPFVSGLGVLCAPDFLADKKLGPFLFEKDHCQRSEFWMMSLLWGFFYYNVLGFLFFAVRNYLKTHGKEHPGHPGSLKMALGVLTLCLLFVVFKNLGIISLVVMVNSITLILFAVPAYYLARHMKIITLLNPVDVFVLILIAVSTGLLVFPEFFYIKDIYPAHYRANTMFKLGYQSFMMLSLVSGYTIFRLKQIKEVRPSLSLLLYNTLYILLFTLIAIYPYFAINSYYGRLQVYKGQDGLVWMQEQYPEDYAAVLWLRQNVVCPGGTSDCQNQPVIAEAVGDSYTDYARVSAYTGLPTIVGWPVHEWLWRGSYDEAGKRIPEVQSLYETANIDEAKKIIDKYGVKYIFVGKLEKDKYPGLFEDKFLNLGTVVFEEGGTKIYRISP